MPWMEAKLCRLQSKMPSKKKKLKINQILKTQNSNKAVQILTWLIYILANSEK